MEFLRLVMLFWDAKVDERTHSFCWMHRLPLIGPIRGKYTVYRPHIIIWTWFILGVWSTWGALEAPWIHWSCRGQVVKGPRWINVPSSPPCYPFHVKVRSMLFLLATFEDEALIMAKSLPDQAARSCQGGNESQLLQNWASPTQEFPSLFSTNEFLN